MSALNPAYQNLYELAAQVGIALRTRCLLYTSDAADERSSVDLGGRRIITKKNITDLYYSLPVKTREHRATMSGH